MMLKINSVKVQHIEIKEKGVAMQMDTISINGKGLPKGNVRINEGFKRNPWQKF